MLVQAPQVIYLTFILKDLKLTVPAISLLE